VTHRISCCVPYCRRTTSAEFREWVCGKHWPLVSRQTKATLRTAKARARRILRSKPQYREYWKLPPGSPARLSAVSMWARLDQAWANCKREAIERAVGI
jgi:hypothetical protein